MVSLKLISRLCFGVSGLIFIVYLGNQFSASSRVPIDLYWISPIQMFVLLLILAALASVGFMIEHHLAAD